MRPSGAREPEEALPPAEHSIRVQRERTGRKGKTVTVVGPFRLRRADAAELLRELKRGCGSGGTLRAASDDGRSAFRFEIQGDHVDALVHRLVCLGYPAKRAGG